MNTWMLLRFPTLLLATLAIACEPSTSDPRPTGTADDVRKLSEREDVNVLFLLVDTLRVDRLSAYGYSRETTPRLEKLVETGIRFDGHLGQSSWTKCSMASMWTGLYPNRSGVRNAQHAIPDEATLPAEILRDAGFRTAGIYRNGWVAGNFGFGQGFEVYMQPVPHVKAAPETQANPGRVAGSDEDVIRPAIEFMRAHADERWFLYLHLLDIHQYASDESSAVFGTRYSDIYDNAILWTDKAIGYLVDVLKELGLSDRTIIVFASDHGEAFGEHGAEGHARDVYGEATETPFMLFLPFQLESGVVIDTQSENVDLWPTLLELLGLPGLEDPDGRSLMPEILAAVRGEEFVANNRMAVAQIDNGWGQIEEDEKKKTIVSFTEAPWRLIYNEARPDYLELFNKQTDPLEQHNLAQPNPEITADLLAKIQSYLERTEAPWGESPQIEIDEMHLRQLRAIGYGVE